LKSDQNGIESQHCSSRSQTEKGLKSDQNGIERPFFSLFAFIQHLLKSDQNGIESLLWVEFQSGT